jgi:glycosyltransferase involved in cell wall biosynthesis
MHPCALIPAYRAPRTVADVVRETRAIWPVPNAVFVIDDGSSDETGNLARSAGAIIIEHANNRGKGAALRTGMEHALKLGFNVAVTLDADAQHPPPEAARLARADIDPNALVLGIRDLVRAGAPRPNQISNRISNFFLSLFTGKPLADTQCGLRRYPIAATLALGGRDNGYAFEAEIIMRALAAGMPIVEEPIDVIYPPADERVTHFNSVRDPARIIRRIVTTLADVRIHPVRLPPPIRSSSASDKPTRDPSREHVDDPKPQMFKLDI